MKICPSCQREFGDNVKFCDTCESADGNAIRLQPKAPPQQIIGKSCPSCNRDYPESAKWCEQCETPDGNPVRLAPKYAAAAPAAPGGITIGEKAVVTGEVIGHKEENKYYGTTTVTNITNTDETKKVKMCAVCGVQGTVEKGFHACPGCGKDVCPTHFDSIANTCVTCRTRSVQDRENQYTQAASRALSNDGLIDAAERTGLESWRKTLGITTERARELEQKLKQDSATQSWGPSQDRELAVAVAALFEEGDANTAVERLQRLVRRFPAREDVHVALLQALEVADPAAAKCAIEAMHIDLAMKSIVAARLLAAAGDYSGAIDRLDEALAVPAFGQFHDDLNACAGEVCLAARRRRRSTLKTLKPDSATCIRRKTPMRWSLLPLRHF